MKQAGSDLEEFSPPFNDVNGGDRDDEPSAECGPGWPRFLLLVNFINRWRSRKIWASCPPETFVSLVFLTQEDDPKVA